MSGAATTMTRTSGRGKTPHFVLGRHVLRYCLAGAASLLLTAVPLVASSQPVSRQLRTEWGARPELVRSGVQLFRMARGADGRLGLEVHARVGSAVAGA